MDDIYILFILISFLASLFLSTKSNQPLYLYLFPLNLAFVLILEILAVKLAYQGKPNARLYNILSSVQIVFYLWVFSQVIARASVKRYLKVVAGLYPFMVIFNKLLIQKGDAYHSLTVALGSLFIVLAAVYYFYELFQSEKSIHLVEEPSFWIASGLLFFYSCSFPLFALINYFYSPSNRIIFNLIYLSSVLNILLYSSFTIAFLCRIKIRKFSL